MTRISSISVLQKKLKPELQALSPIYRNGFAGRTSAGFTDILSPLHTIVAGG